MQQTTQESAKKVAIGIKIPIRYPIQTNMIKVEV